MRQYKYKTPYRFLRLREKKGLSQNELGKAIGFSGSMIGAVENGDKEPSARMLRAYSKYFGVSTDYLLGLSDEWRRAAK